MEEHRSTTEHDVCPPFHIWRSAFEDVLCIAQIAEVVFGKLRFFTAATIACTAT